MFLDLGTLVAKSDIRQKQLLHEVNVDSNRTSGPIYCLGQFIIKTYAPGQDIYQGQIAITVTNH